jgi:hypothetical protein
MEPQGPPQVIPFYVSSLSGQKALLPVLGEDLSEPLSAC